MTGGRSPSHESIVAPSAPPPAGPYAHAVRAGDTIYLAGHTPRHAETGVIAGTFAEQAERTFESLAVTATAAGASLDRMVRMAVYLASYDHFDELNEICARHLTPPYPARTTIVAGLRGMLIEIDAVLWVG